MRKIYILGSVNIDLNTVAPKFPKKDSTVYSTHFSFSLGGKATNVAVGLRRLGLRPVLVSAVGGDIFGNCVLKQLRLSGLSTRYVEQLNGVPTGSCITITDIHNHNSNLVNEGACKIIGEELFTRATKYSALKDVFYLTTEIPVNMIQFAVRHMRKKINLTIANAGPKPLNIKSSLSFIDIVIMNIQEAEVLSGIKIKDRASIEKAAAKIRLLGGKDIIITMADKGVFLLPEKADKGMIFDPVHVDVTDLAGAGDAFRAAFIETYLTKHNLVEALDRANFAGAYAVTKLGSQEALPTKRQLTEFIKSVRG